MISLGKSDRARCLPYRHFIPLYNQCRTIYRFDTDRHTGSTRTGHGRIYRSCRLWRSFDTEDRLRNTIDHSRRDDHHCRQQHHEPFDPFQEALSPIADRKEAVRRTTSKKNRHNRLQYSKKGVNLHVENKND